MGILITGAAGNLGGFLARHLAANSYNLRLVVHRRPVAGAVAALPNVQVFQSDFSDPGTLRPAMLGADAVFHFAGVLFKPRPEKSLPESNTRWAANLVNAAVAAGVKKIILINFRHVEGETTPADPARGRLDGHPTSVHAHTRLAAERYLFNICKGTGVTPVSLRPGMIYGKGVLI